MALISGSRPKSSYIQSESERPCASLLDTRPTNEFIHAGPRILQGNHVHGFYENIIAKSLTSSCLN